MSVFDKTNDVLIVDTLKMSFEEEALKCLAATAGLV